MNKINNKKGFSLVELIVVIAIISILSFSSVIGFGHLGDILKVNEIHSLIKDVIKKEELQVLRGDFTNSTIHFLKDYIVVEEEVENSALRLKFVKNDTSCPLNFLDKGNLKKWDKDGKTLSIKSVKTNSSTEKCIDFSSSNETELNYQLIDSGKYSNIIKFIHFNINRDDPGNLVTIKSGTGSKIEIKAPYAKKYFYGPKGSMRTDSNNPIKLVIGNQNSENTFILE